MVGENEGDFIDQVLCWDLMSWVLNNQIDGAKAREIMEKRYGKDKVDDVIRRAEEAGYIG